MILLIAVFALPLKISVLAIIAFDTGMGAAMLIVAFVLGYPPTTIALWFVMWGGLLLGFMTAYPMVRWLLGRGATGYPVVSLLIRQRLKDLI